jgi:alpha-L-fucosidase
MTLYSSGKLVWNLQDGPKQEKVVNKLKRIYEMIECKHKNTQVFEWASLKYQDYARSFYGKTAVCIFCDTAVKTTEQTPDGVLITDHIKGTEILEDYR